MVHNILSPTLKLIHLLTEDNHLQYVALHQRLARYFSSSIYFCVKQDIPIGLTIFPQQLIPNQKQLKF